MASDILSYNVVQDHEGVDNYEYRLTSLTLYIVFEISFLQVVRVSPAPGLRG